MKASFKKRSQDELEKFYQQNALFINSLESPKTPTQSKVEIKQMIELTNETESVQKPVQIEPKSNLTKSKTEQRKQK